jgi:hypothetical protein
MNSTLGTLHALQSRIMTRVLSASVTSITIVNCMQYENPCEEKRVPGGVGGNSGLFLSIRCSLSA